MTISLTYSRLKSIQIRFETRRLINGTLSSLRVCRDIRTKRIRSRLQTRLSCIHSIVLRFSIVILRQVQGYGICGTLSFIRCLDGRIECLTLFGDLTAKPISGLFHCSGFGHCTVCCLRDFSDFGFNGISCLGKRTIGSVISCGLKAGNIDTYDIRHIPLRRIVTCRLIDLKGHTSS